MITSKLCWKALGNLHQIVGRLFVLVVVISFLPLVVGPNVSLLAQNDVGAESGVRTAV
jgi:hypothetical protein